MSYTGVNLRIRITDATVFLDQLLSRLKSYEVHDLHWIHLLELLGVKLNLGALYELL